MRFSIIRLPSPSRYTPCNSVSHCQRGCWRRSIVRASFSSMAFNLPDKTNAIIQTVSIIVRWVICLSRIIDFFSFPRKNRSIGLKRHRPHFAMFPFARPGNLCLPLKIPLRMKSERGAGSCQKKYSFVIQRPKSSACPLAQSILNSGRESALLLGVRVTTIGA